MAKKPNGYERIINTVHRHGEVTRRTIMKETGLGETFTNHVCGAYEYINYFKTYRDKTQGCPKVYSINYEED